MKTEVREEGQDGREVAEERKVVMGWLAGEEVGPVPELDSELINEVFSEDAHIGQKRRGEGGDGGEGGKGGGGGGVRERK